MKRLGVVLVVGLLSTQAQAHHHYRTHHHSRASSARHTLRHVALTRAAVSGGRFAAARFSTTRPSDCYGIPWCGCWLRHALGVKDAAYNLARNWTHYGRDAHGPDVGVVVVWPHHVGRIVGRGTSGGWVVESGNDGHRVRARVRSLAGAIAFRSQS